jgi:hypothetical protein
MVATSKSTRIPSKKGCLNAATSSSRLCSSKPQAIHIEFLSCSPWPGCPLLQLLTWSMTGQRSTWSMIYDYTATLRIGPAAVPGKPSCTSTLVTLPLARSEVCVLSAASTRAVAPSGTHGCMAPAAASPHCTATATKVCTSLAIGGFQPWTYSAPPAGRRLR